MRSIAAILLLFVTSLANGQGGRDSAFPLHPLAIPPATALPIQPNAYPASLPPGHTASQPPTHPFAQPAAQPASRAGSPPYRVQQAPYNAASVSAPPPFDVRPAAAELELVQPPPLEVEPSPPVEMGNQNGAAGANFDTMQAGQRFPVGVDFYSTPDFRDGLIIFGPNVAMKFGGYVKADFIYDFDPIESTDLFDTTTIEVGAPPRTNARYHARQTRFSFDTRWATNQQVVRIFVEGDFFSDGDRFRLRHAFGESENLLVGQTWTTFTDVAAAPATLDFEGSVSSVNRRQAQARWTIPLIDDSTTLALAVEDTQFIVVTTPGVMGETRSPSPDFVSHVRFTDDWGQFQAAQLFRSGGFQEIGQPVETVSAWGLNFTGVLLLTQDVKVYGQVVFGDGIGSYRGLPDAALTRSGDSVLLGLFGWMVGVTLDWTDSVNSNFTYAESRLDNVDVQRPSDIQGNTYLAANILWNPLERVTVGLEVLYGTRENFNGNGADARRVQAAFIFDLP